MQIDRGSKSNCAAEHQYQYVALPMCCVVCVCCVQKDVVTSRHVARRHTTLRHLLYCVLVSLIGLVNVNGTRMVAPAVAVLPCC